MVQRRQVIETVFNTVQDAVTGTYTITGDDGSTYDVTITDSDVLRYHPDDEEKHPAVFVDFANERPLNYNGIGNTPGHIERDSNNNVVYVSWNEHIEMETFVTVRADSRVQKEPIFDTARGRLGRYDGGDLHPTQLHEHINTIDIEETTPADSTGVESSIWGDQIQLYITYLRRYIIESGGTKTMDETVDTVENISQINLEVDNNLDFADEGFTYTIN